MIFFIINLVFTQELGSQKSQYLRKRSQQSANNIIRITSAQINQYVMTFPRPYDLVIYFAHKNSRLSKQMQGQFIYLADLYVKAGCLYPQIVDRKVRSAVYFVYVQFGSDTRFFYELFEFKSAPNIVVSKPKMAILNQAQSKRYLKSFLWQISYNDGHVTTHKMLQFTNKRTQRNVNYKPPFSAILQSIVIFLIFCGVGYYAITQLSNFWMNPRVWLIVALAIYVTFSSGIIFNILHGTQLVGRTAKGDVQIFSGGNREQYGFQGFLIAFLSMSIGLCLILIKKVHKFTKNLTQQRVVFGVLILSVIIMVRFIQQSYKTKSAYGPSFYPPQGYQMGSVFHDQGHST